MILPSSLKTGLKAMFMILLVCAVLLVYGKSETDANLTLDLPKDALDRFDARFKSIQEECGDQSDVLILKAQYAELMELALECRTKLKTEIRELDKARINFTDQEIIEYEERKALGELSLDELEYLYEYSALLTSDQDEMSLMTEYFMLTDKLISKYYLLKVEHTQVYANHMDTRYVSNILENFRQFNNKLGDEYDDVYSDDLAKYFMQINPSNDAVVYQTERVTQGTKNPDEMKWRIFDFVRESTFYKHDPNWKTDWVQPPALTLLSGTGDCDDQSVLLASMFMRAGIKEVKLCYTDDHMFVSAEGTKWDSTCKTCDEKPAPDIKEATCVEVNDYLSRLNKCSDGTERDSCSTQNPGLYCDQAGQLRHACGACGCQGSFCDTEDQQCFTCEQGFKGFPGKKCCPHGTSLSIMGVCI